MGVRGMCVAAGYKNRGADTSITGHATSAVGQSPDGGPAGIPGAGLERGRVLAVLAEAMREGLEGVAPVAVDLKNPQVKSRMHTLHLNLTLQSRLAANIRGPGSALASATDCVQIS